MKSGIISYTAREAIEDGILHDVPHTLSQACGFRLPVRITCGVYDLLDGTDVWRFIEGLEQTLMKAQEAIQQSECGEWQVEFSVERNGKRKTLWAAFDNTCDMAIHILKPEEY